MPWAGIRSPQAKDYLAKYQVTAEGWYVANDLTVAETRRLKGYCPAQDAQGHVRVDVGAMPPGRWDHCRARLQGIASVGIPSGSPETPAQPSAPPRSCPDIRGSGA